MKTAIKTTAILFAFSLMLTSMVNATIRTVDNNFSRPVGAYADIPAAISASTDGDTIYVEGSPINYGAFTLDRRIIFIGAGFKPSYNTSYVSKVGTITLTPLPFPTASPASHSKFIGLWIEPQANNPGINLFCNCFQGSQINSLQITRCIFKMNNGVAINLNAQFGDVNATIIEGCVFLRQSTTDMQDDIFLGGASVNNIIRNNIISTNVYATHNELNSSSPQIINNIFLVQTSNTSNVVRGSFQKVSNNIFLSTTPAPPTNSSVTFNWSPTLISGSSGFVNNISGGGNPFTASAGLFDFYPAKNYRVLSTSNCHNAGYDGTDLGVYGGFTGSYSDTGEPAIPVIKAFTITSGTTIQQGGTGTFNFISKTVK